MIINYRPIIIKHPALGKFNSRHLSIIAYKIQTENVRDVVSYGSTDVFLWIVVITHAQ